MESSQNQPVFTRTLNLSPTAKPLKMRIAPDKTVVALIGKGAVLKKENGFTIMETMPSAPVQVKILIGSAGTKGLTDYAKSSAPPASLVAMTTGGPSRFPKKLSSQVTMGTQEGPFQVDLMNPPFDSPGKINFDSVAWIFSKIPTKGSSAPQMGMFGWWKDLPKIQENSPGSESLRGFSSPWASRW